MEATSRRTLPVASRAFREASGTGTPAITTLLCDLDGTLIDSGRDIAVAFQHAVRRATGATPPPTSLITRHIGKPLVLMARELGYALSPPQQLTFLEAYRQYYALYSVRYTRPYPDVRATLLQLASTTLGVVTTKEQERAESVLRQLALSAYFRHIQGSRPGLRSKPAPDLIEAALVALQCPPEQALMVGDTAADIHAGRAAGTRTCAVTYGFGRAEELERLQPDFCIASFRDLVRIVSTW